MHYWIMLLRLAIVLVPAYVAAYLTGEMVWVVPTLVGSGLVAAGIKSKTPTTRVDEDGDPGGYVNRCVNDIRRRPSQPLAQRRFHPRIERRDRRLRSTQGPSDA